jgi:hypothetical protein
MQEQVCWELVDLNAVLAQTARILEMEHLMPHQICYAGINLAVQLMCASSNRQKNALGTHQATGSA